MAKVINKPKVILTKEELETLRKARRIVAEIYMGDKNELIFNMVDNIESGLGYIATAIEILENISEVE